MTKGLNIVSRLTFENIPDGTLPTSIPDENQYSNYSYTRYAGTVSVNVETVNGIKFIKLASSTSNSKIYAQNVINDQSKKNFQAEFDVIFDSISTEMTLAAIGSSNALTTMLRVVAYADPTKGIALVNDIRSINSYYKFETNKKYTICVGMKDNVISMYIDGTIIGYSYSEEFTNNLNVVTPASIILGSTALTNASATGGMLTGKLGNINISSGPTVKHEESYTKYGTNLVSFLNFENLLTTGTYKAGLEAVYEGIEWRGVESVTYSNGYGNIKNISTDLTGEFTVKFSLKKFKVANANILKYGNYSVDYAAGFIPVPDPDVIVNEYTTAALNFENGLVDQIGTTVWTKEGTADITSVNKIFGENSFETKALGDSLYTNSNIITGGSTPVTIEFYALNRNTIDSNGNIFISKCIDAPAGEQWFRQNAATNNMQYVLNTAFPNISSTISVLGKEKINNNEINKHTISYDGSCIRTFLNDKLDIIYGSNIGLHNTNQPFRFLGSIIGSSNSIRGFNGIIDNINIHDGIATKVRDPDPYEEFLVVDLAFDGENNSTKIVDNAGLNERNKIKYNDNIVSLLHFEEYNNSIFTDECGHLYVSNGSATRSSAYKKFGSSSLSISTTDNSNISCNSNDFIFGAGDYTIECFFMVSGGNNSIFTFDGGSVYVNEAANLLTLYSSGNKISIGGIVLNEWMHVALIRKDGNVSLYLNGIKSPSWQDTRNLNTGLIQVGGSTVGTGGKYYIDELRVIKGKAVYTENFTPPTEPFNYVKHNKWTVKGDAKLSTAQKFDGFSSLTTQSSGLIYTNSNQLDFKNENFTISFDILISNYTNADKFNTIFATNWGYGDTTIIDNYLLLSIGSPNDGLGRNKRLYFRNTRSSILFISNNQIDENKMYSIKIIRQDNKIILYVNGKTDTIVPIDSEINFSNIPEFVLGCSTTSVYAESLNGYIKNFKIYKGVAVIPEDPTGKIQLDFDNNFNDKYGNSTWTNNGVTFDQVNSVKGHAAKFNGSNSILSISNNQNLNFENKNFVLSYDFKNAIFDSVNNRYLLGNGMALAHGAFWRLFGTSSSKSGSVNLNYNSTNYGLTNTVEVENNYYNEKILRNIDTLVGFKNDVAISALNVINTFNVDFKNMSIGTASSLTSGVSYFNGYLDNFKTYKEDLLTNNDITIFTDPAVTVNYKILDDCIYVTGSGPTSSSNGTSIIKLNESPSLKNFTAEIKLYFDATNIYMYGGLIFRTIEYKIRTPQMGYLIYFTVTGGKTHLRFGKGSNGSTDSWTQIHTIDVDSYRNNTYRTLKVIAKDNNFKAYIDNILIFDVIDDSYNISSQFGMNSFNYFNTAMYSKTKRVNIWDENGNNVYYKDWKSKISNVIDKPAVHLPLETNAINTGFTPLTINSVGNPTYTTIDGKKCIKFESGKYLSINSNNIFNLGTNSDFYIEFDFYPLQLGNRIRLLSNNIGVNDMPRFGIASDNAGYARCFYINDGATDLYTSNSCILDTFNKIIVYRNSNNLYLILNGVLTQYKNYNGSINFTSNVIFGVNPTDASTTYNGYMSNFKMFVGTSEVPETYNDKKVLDLDFKPTGKSYLFKDNNNKCVIHPVNITQRDYQNSQYCCSFNGVDQYLQLGKNDIFNFGLDDFVIEIIFKTNESKDGVLLHSGETSNTNSRAAILIGDTSFNNRIYIHTQFNGTYYYIASSNSININEINKLIVYRKNGIINIILNDILSTDTFNYDLNFNINSNTYIGRRDVSANNYWLKGTIYSIKILRNTTDLSLLEDENSNVIAGDTTLTLSNGTDSQEVIFDNKDQNDFRFVHSNDSTKLIVNEQILEVPNVENELNELSLFTDFSAQAKDIKTYNIAFEDEDSFSGNVPIHTQFGEIEEISTLSDEFIVVDQGDFIVNGFFEGRPEDSRYQIRNRFDYIVMHSDSGPFNYNGINERYIDDYEIYLSDTNETMPIPTEPMIRGYITVSITPTECEGINFGVKVFRRSDNKLIGIYNFNNYICTIDNLDCNKRYDCIIFDQDVNLESRCLSNRTPIPY